MSATKFTKDSREWQMFVDYWNLCQKYWLVSSHDEYWKSVTNDAIAFGEKYKDISLASKLAIAFLEDLKEKNDKILESDRNG